jgi:hypothetical protein
MIKYKLIKQRFMKTKPILLCLIMITVSFAGCFGGNETIVTDEGDPVTPGESLDDWPTYYVATANDLPTCDANTLGRLYYVEADTNFQACTSNGWTVVQIGNNGSNLIINSPPLMKVRTTIVDDDLISDDGDGTFSINMGFAWNATDIDGTITTLGVDYNGDFVIDYILLDNPSMGENIVNPAQNNQISDFNGFIPIPLEEGISVFRWADSISSEYVCSLSTNREITFIAIDDGGAIGVNTLMFDGLGDLVYSEFINTDWDLVELETLGVISQADVDWLTGTDLTSPCPVPSPQPSVEICDDGVDNDGDNYIDCDDWDCDNDQNCASSIPPPEVTNVVLSFDNNRNNYAQDEGEYKCEYDFFYANGGPDNSEIEWYADLVLVDTTPGEYPHYPKAMFPGGSLVTCQVTPMAYDQGNNLVQGIIVFSNPLLRNTPPTIDNVLISPNQVYTQTTLTCSYTFNDVDNAQNDQSTIEWLVNGAVIATGSTYNVTDVFNPLGGPYIIDCMVLGNDGTDSQLQPGMASTELQNSPPTVTNVVLTHDDVNDEYMCSYDYNDPDMTPDESEIQWLVNGNEVIFTDASTGYLIYGFELGVNPGDEVQCVIWAIDGYEQGNTDSSNILPAV